LRAALRSQFLPDPPQTNNRIHEYELSVKGLTFSFSLAGQTENCHGRAAKKIILQKKLKAAS